MPLYTYNCKDCNYTFEEDYCIAERDVPTLEPCPICGNFRIIKVMNAVDFKVNGANANNGYSTYVGDAQKFNKDWKAGD